MQVSVPRSFNRSTMYDLLSEVIDDNMNPKDNKIKFDFYNLSFIEPAGVTILSNLFEWLIKKGVETKIICPANRPGKWDPIQFLDDSKFFIRYVGQNITTNPVRRPTTIPLELIAYTNSASWLENEFSYWLSGRLGLHKSTLSTIRICFGEIFNNIRDHAQENIGCIFAQHYPSNEEVKITISDFGIGIPNKVREIEPSLNDDKAIKLATTEGFTTQTTPRNLGAGLHTLIENVVNNNHGSVHIHSNYGILDCVMGNNNNEICKRASLASGFYPGTLIEIVLRTDTIQNITDIEEEFEW